MITLRTGGTSEAEIFVQDNINKIGKLISIHHKRDRKKVYYVTTFKGEDGTIEIEGGLTSGFNGTGPSGLVRVLVSLGLSRELASEYVYGKSEQEQHEFLIEL